jgi:hypothetical protein
VYLRLLISKSCRSPVCINPCLYIRTQTSSAADRIHMWRTMNLDMEWVPFQTIC